MAEFIKGGGSRLALRLASPGDYEPSGETGTPDYETLYELPFTTEAFNPTGEFINSNAILGGRSRGVGCIGNKAGDGSFDVEVTIGNFLYLIYAVLGKVYEVEDTYNFTIVPSADELPVYDIYVKHGAGDDFIKRFEDCTINSFRLSFGSNTLLTASLDWSGKKQSPAVWVSGEDYVVGDMVLGTDSNYYICIADDTGSTIQPPEAGSATYWKVGFPTELLESFASTQVFVCPLKIGTEIDLTNSGKTLSSFNVLPYTTGLELTIANNLDTDTNALNAGGRLAIISGELAVTGSITFLVPKPDGVVDNFISLLDDLDIGDLFASSIVIKLYKTVSASSGEGDSDYENYLIALRNVYTTQLVHDITDRNKIAYRVDFQAVANKTSSGYGEYPITVHYIKDDSGVDNVMYFPVSYA